MVSPSKLFKTSNSDFNADIDNTKKNNLNFQKGSKQRSLSAQGKNFMFLANTKFYLDIRNRSQLNKVESTLKSYGAKIEVFFSKDIKIVVTDRTEWIGSSQSPSASISPLTTPSPSSVQDQRFHLPKSRASAMLEKVSRQPASPYCSPLELAQKWKIPILPVPNLWKWIAKVKEPFFSKLNEKKKQKEILESKIVVYARNSPFIKIESFVSPNAPQFEELGTWPKLHLDGFLGQCPFHFPCNSNFNEPSKKVENKFLEVKNKVAVELIKYDTNIQIKNNLKSQECEDDKKIDLEKQSISPFGLNRRWGHNICTCNLENKSNFLLFLNDFDDFSKMTRRLGKSNVFNSEEDTSINPDNKQNTSPLCNGHASRNITRQSSQELLKVQCNGLTTGHRNSKLLSPSGSDVLPLPTSRRSTRRASASWCGSTRELSQLSPTDSEIENIRRSDGSFEPHDPGSESPGITLRPKGQLWLPIALIGTTAEENGNGVRKRYDYSIRQSIENFKLSSDLLDPIGEKPRYEIDENQAKPRISKESELSISSNWSSQNDIHIKKNLDKKDTYCIITRNAKIKSDEKNGRSRESSIDSHKSEQEQPKSRMEGKKRSLSAGGRLSPSLKRARTMSTNSAHSNGRKKKLSPEEKLLQDNKEYFKMEVLNTKLRSSGSLLNICQNREAEANCENTKPLEKIEKIIIKKIKLRGKRKKSRWAKANSKKVGDVNYATIIVKNKKNNVKINGIIRKKRQSELMKLCNEAESFMFGESSRQGSNMLSVTENNTEDSSKKNNNFNLNKVNMYEEVSLDSNGENERKKIRKRRSHAEAFIHDNLDYYKFETPGSRLRYQGSFLDVKSEDKDFIYTLKHKKKERLPTEQCKKNETYARLQISNDVIDEKSEAKRQCIIPSEEVEKIMFSFESIPCTEPWYEVYKRQDEGMENYYPLLSDPNEQPFLLPYELPKHTYLKVPVVSEYYKRRRKKLSHVFNHPRKSPRCHASTLAILSSLKKRKRKSGMNLSMNSMISELPINSNYPSEKSEGRLNESEKNDVHGEEILDFLYNEDLNEETDDFLLEPISDSENKANWKSSDTRKSEKCDEEDGKNIKTGIKNKKSIKLESQSDFDSVNNDEKLFSLQTIRFDPFFKEMIIKIKKKSGLNLNLTSILESFKNCKSMDMPERGLMSELHGYTVGVAPEKTSQRRRKKARKINKTGWDNRKTRRKLGNKVTEVKSVETEEQSVTPNRVKTKVKSKETCLNSDNVIAESKRRKKKRGTVNENRPILRSHLEGERTANLRRTSQDSESSSESLDSATQEYPSCVVRVKKINEASINSNLRLKGSNSKYNLQKRRLVLSRKKKVSDYAWTTRRR